MNSSICTFQSFNNSKQNVIPVPVVIDPNLLIFYDFIGDSNALQLSNKGISTVPLDISKNSADLLPGILKFARTSNMPYVQTSTSNYISLYDSVSYSYTICCWFKPIIQINSFQIIYRFGLNSTQFSVNNDNQYLCYDSTNYRYSNDYINISSSVTPSLNTKVHIVVVVEVTSASKSVKYTIYINGTIIAINGDTTARSRTFTGNNYTPLGSIGKNGNNFCFFGTKNGSSFGDYSPGEISNFRFYNKALNQEQISYLYNNNK
jgi:hypothetical protein